MGDLTTLPNENLPPARGRTPALPAPELSVEFLARLKEIVEVLLGQRGSSWDRAVTFRDLNTAGIASFVDGPAGYETGGFQAAGDQSAAAQVDTLIRKSKAYRELTAKVGALQTLEGFPDEIRTQLSLALTDLARDRQADIQSVERRIQTDSLSMASRLTELTASLEGTAAGVREFDSAYADGLRAVALRIEQVAAEIDGGGSAEIEQRLEAVADLVEGLSAQYSLKVQTNPVNGQPPVIAGISLSANSPVAGPGTSSLIFLAQAIQFLTDAGAVAPFSIVGNQVKVTNLIAQALKVIMEDGTVVLDASKTLAQQTASNPNLVPNCMGWPFTTGPASRNRNGDPRFGDGQYFALSPGADPYIGVDSPPMGIPAGAVYTVSFDAYCINGTRQLNADVYAGPGFDSNGIGPTIDATMRHYKFTETAPNNADAPLARLRLAAGPASSGTIIIANVKVELGAKDTAWSDDIVTTANAKNRVFIPYLAALSGFFGSVELGTGGALWSGQPDYDVGNGLRLGTDAAGNPYLSMRSASGKYLRIRPSTDTFEFNGVTLNGTRISQPVYDTFSFTVVGGGYVAGPNNQILGNSVDLSITGSNGPFKVVWTYSRLIGGPPSTPSYIDPNPDKSFGIAVGPASNTTISFQVSAVITGIDGRTLNYSDVFVFQFGTI